MTGSDCLLLPLEGEPHAYFSSEAGIYLIRLLGNRAMVRSAKPIMLPNNSEPEPDIAVVQQLGVSTWSITPILKIFSS